MKLDAFWSDQHFGHVNIIEYAKRPFDSVEEMGEAMIKNYNEVVGPSDVCLWGGDCFMGTVDGKEILGRLNGVKLLVLGNHDKKASRMFEMGFSAVANEMFLNIAGRPTRVCHRPYWTEPKGELVDRHGRPIERSKLNKLKKLAPPRVKGEILLHGHTHDSRKRRDNMVHIGVDAWGFRPATWGEVEALAKEI